MRLRKQHTWGAVLVALFGLPILLPRGLPVLERPLGGALAWFGRVTLLNPELWGSSAAPGDDVTPRERRLEEENAVLREHIAQRMQLQEDAERLQAALAEDGLRASGLDRLPEARIARVLRTTDAVPTRRSITIDRGAEDGLVPGLAVAFGEVFLGRVEVVHGRSALVELVTDPHSRLEVAFRTDRGRRLTGYVRGEGRGGTDREMDVRHVRADDDCGRVAVGASVFTSNADPLVPAGLLVGHVTHVSDKNLDGMPTIRIRPALDLERSTRVMVLVPKP